MRTADRISGTFWLIFALVTIVKAYGLGLGSLFRPGPGFLFFWVGILLAIMSLAIIIKPTEVKQEGEPGKPIFADINFKKIIQVLIAVFFYALLLESLGFVVVTTLFFFFILRVVEKKGWLFTILTSIFVTGIAYLVFQVWLQTQLPEGILEFLRL
ncbi:MAG: tripartite tricarboxylate transporter TctB family protein [Deltaproteobacteria bacterium]|jgi:putative tricarboxylic transport membrane protein